MKNDMDLAQIIIREVKLDDFEEIKKCAFEIGPGFTSFPKDEQFILDKIKRSVSSYKDSSLVEEPLYLLILEDAASGDIIGFSGIEAKIGKATPFYNYKINTIYQVSDQVDKSLEHKSLSVVNDFQGVSELVSLYIKPEFRGNKRGECLSRARFLYMRNNMDSFGDVTIAEIRGMVTENGNSPFWDAIGAKFFDMDFTKADFLSAVTNKQFISDLMPRKPIYVDLLPEDAINVIGEPQQESAKAMQFLENEGFSFRDYIDIFDAGPVVQSNTDRIKTINDTRDFTVSIVKKPGNKSALLASLQGPFRATAGMVDIIGDDKVAIDSYTADRLNVKENSPVMLVDLED